MFGHETRWYHFLAPVLFIFIGAGVFYIDEWAGTLTWVVSILMTGWLIGTSILEKYRDLLESQIALYKLTNKMTADEKAEHGLIEVPDTVRIERVNHESGYSRWEYDFLSLSPPRLREVARLCYSGTPFSIRGLTGQGKPLSDPEWRILKDELLKAEMIVPRSEKGNNLGFMWTDTGMEMLEKLNE